MVTKTNYFEPCVLLKHPDTCTCVTPIRSPCDRKSTPGDPKCGIVNIIPLQPCVRWVLVTMVYTQQLLSAYMQVQQQLCQHQQDVVAAVVVTLLVHMYGWRVHCRNGIEGLNDDLLTRGFAMNEAGGILKVC